MQPYTPKFLYNQAHRTAPTRQFFYQQMSLKDAPICLDIGCGAGVITPEISENLPCSTVIGFDIDQSLLQYAITKHSNRQALHYIFADATALPFRTNVGDFAFSHFTLMWIPNRNQALNEIHKTLSARGILACIEPDYSGRIEIYESGTLGKAKPPFPIAIALTRLGADPYTGGQLPGELTNLNFCFVRFGVLSWMFDPKGIEVEIQSEAILLQEKGIEWVLPTFIYTPIFWIFATKSP